MEKPVDPDTGRRDGYGYNKVPYLEWLVGNELRNAAATVVRDVVKEQALPAIEAQVRAKLSSAEITQSFVGAISAALKDEWRINVHFDREKDR
jgi:hypothetical protein